MKNRIKVYPIGKIENENSKTVLRLKPGYREGLKGLADSATCRSSGGWTAVMIRKAGISW